jgi:hypothetical protein
VILQSSSSGWALIVLVAVITPTRVGAGDATTPAPTPDDGQAYFFTWSGTARGSESGDKFAPDAGIPGYRRSTATAQGSAVVKFDRFGTGSVRALRVSESYQFDRYAPAGLRLFDNTYVPYGPWHDHESLIRTDDTNWARFGSGYFSMPHKRADGTWAIMVKPAFEASCLRTEVFADLSASCNFDNKKIAFVCPPRQGSKIGIVTCSPSGEIFASDAGKQSNIVLEANTPAPDFFSKHAHYVGEAWRAGFIVGPDFKTDIDWTITVRRIGKCKIAGMSPLNDQPANPDINDEDIEMGVEHGSDTIDPDSGIAGLNIRVTCDGVPIKNALVEAKVEVQKNTGGHTHDAAGRPRGSLNGTKLSDDKPSIQQRTDADGRIHLSFKAGKAKNHDDLGIAGIYKITATSVRFPSRKAEVAVEAKVDGLSPLDGDPNYVDDVHGSSHTSGDNATAATKQRLSQFANAFYEAQVLHNDQLFFSCKAAKWRIYPLWVIDVSLPFGGQYDLGPPNGAFWSTPHQTHQRGDGVDFSVHRRNESAAAWPADGFNVPICDGYKIAPQGWLMMKMWELGEPKYGHWDKSDFNANSQPWHLHVSQ